MENYLVSVNLFNQFLEHLKGKGVTFTNKELNESQDLMKMQLHAYVARNILGDQGFYPILFKQDETVTKALSLLEKSWTSKEISELAEVVQLK